MKRPRLAFSLLAVAALAVTACRAAYAPVPTTLALPAGTPGQPSQDGAALLANVRAAGLDAALVATGATTGHVFDLELASAVGASSSDFAWQGRAFLLAPAGRRLQSYLVVDAVRALPAPGGTLRVPLHGFCLDPGLSPWPAGLRVPLEDALLASRRRPLAIHDSTAPGPDGPLRVVPPGPEGIDLARALGAALPPGPLFLVVGSGRVRVHDPARGAWHPAPGDEGMVRVVRPGGRAVGAFTVAPAGATAIADAAVEDESGVHAADPLVLLRHRIAEHAVDHAPAAVAEKDLRDLDAPATTIAQQAIWRAAERLGPIGVSPAAVPEPALPADVDDAVEAVLEDARHDVAEEDGLDFAMFDLAAKP